MRGDGVGIGHVDEVQGRAGYFGDKTSGHDDWAEIGERNRGVVRGHGRTQSFSLVEPGECWGKIDDSAWGKHWEDGIHRTGSGRADRMRGDRVGIRHVGEVQGRTGGIRDAARGSDGRRAVRKYFGGVFDRRFKSKHSDCIEPPGWWTSLGNCARDGPRECWGKHRANPVGTDRMRGYGLGITNIGQLHVWPGYAGISTSNSDGGNPCGQLNRLLFRRF